MSLRVYSFGFGFESSGQDFMVVDSDFSSAKMEPFVEYRYLSYISLNNKGSRDCFLSNQLHLKGLEATCAQ